MTTERMAGAIAGGLVAGLGLTALLLAGERKSGKPNEIVALERASAARLGWATPAGDILPDRAEQAAAQGGHFLLSALAGAAYAAVTDEDAPVLKSGITFGLAFYVADALAAGAAPRREEAGMAERRRHDRHARAEPCRVRHRHRRFCQSGKPQRGSLGRAAKGSECWSFNGVNS